VSSHTPASLQFEGATFAGVEHRDGLIAIHVTGAESYSDASVEEYPATICIVDGEVVGNVPRPSRIEEVSLLSPGVGSWHVYVVLPFALSGTCTAELVLTSSESLRVEGRGLYIEHGCPSTRYSLTPVADGS
jgi:hypothetical protein